jgi:hypothetical protein
MAITFPTAYPAELTNKPWQKQKSFLDKAKAKTKTGLGALLDKAEQEWGKINWNVMIEKKQTPDPSNFLGSHKANRLAAQQQIDGQVNTAYLALMAASRKARDTAAIKGLSKTAITAATTLSNKLQQQAAKLKGIKLTDFDAQVDALQKAADAQDGIYDKGVADVNRGLGVLKADSSFAGWEKAGMLNKTSYVRSQVYSAIQVGRTDFQPLKPAWLTVTKLTTETENKVKGADPAGDTKIIKKYLTDVNKLVAEAKI